jgi:hypothetical protein
MVRNGKASSVQRPKLNRYGQLIESIFQSHYKKGMREVPFQRDELISTARKLKIALPKNLGDVIYSFRYRASFPDSIKETASEGEGWIIRPVGRGMYCFVMIKAWDIKPSEMMSQIKIPDATPGIVAKYLFDDEQALLAKLRYNRLIDLFLGLTCYSLQNHLRTTVPNMGQVETDEIYVGLDTAGVHYVLPVQAKGGTDKHNIVQIEQDFALCADKFPQLVCRAIGAQFIEADLIALFEFETGESGVSLRSEKHYKLVPPEGISQADLLLYRGLSNSVTSREVEST